MESINTFMVKDWELCFMFWHFPIPSIESMKEAKTALEKAIKKWKYNQTIFKYNRYWERQMYEQLDKMRWPKEQIRNKIKWHIYFIKDSLWFIKIWKSKDFNKRHKKYITENSQEIEVIKVIDSLDITWDERKYHDMFKSKRKNWERFELDKEDIYFIMSL